MNRLCCNPTDCHLGAKGHITPKLTRASPPPPAPLLAVTGFTGFLIALLTSTMSVARRFLFITHLILRWVQALE